MSPGNHLHSADLRGELSLSSQSSVLYNMSYYAGWNIANVYAHSTSYPYRPGDVLSISKHRSTSFVKYCQYLNEFVVERWMRRGLVHLMAGTMSDKLGSSVILVALFSGGADGTSASTGTGTGTGSTAVAFATWYKDLVNNQLCKANTRSFALAPCVSHAYRIAAASDGVVTNSKLSRECLHRGIGCNDTLWTKALV